MIRSLCGTTTVSNVVPDYTTQHAVEPNTLLVIFNSESLPSGNGKYQFTVTAEADPCMGDPCHGVPCQRSNSDPSAHTCLFPGLCFFFFARCVCMIGVCFYLCSHIMKIHQLSMYKCNIFQLFCSTLYPIPSSSLYVHFQGQ